MNHSINQASPVSKDALKKSSQQQMVQPSTYHKLKCVKATWFSFTKFQVKQSINIAHVNHSKLLIL